MDLNYAEMLQQPIKKIYAIFNKPATENILTMLRDKLELGDDAKFSSLCASLLIYDELKILHGTLAFNLKLMSGDIYPEDKKGVWVSFVKLYKVVDADKAINEVDEEEPIDAYDRTKPLFIRKVDQLNLDGTLVESFDSMNDAAKAMGSSPLFIALCCIGEAKTACDFKWRFSDETAKTLQSS